MMSPSIVGAVSELLCCAGLVLVVTAWLLEGRGVRAEDEPELKARDFLSLLAGVVLCVRVLATAAHSMAFGNTAEKPTVQLPPPQRRRNRAAVPAAATDAAYYTSCPPSLPPRGGAPSHSTRAPPVCTPPAAHIDAAAVVYRPFAPGLAGVSPARAPSTVADKLDTFLTILDFIPVQYHAAIRANKVLGQGNTDLTEYFQRAIDFTDYLKTPQTGGSLIVVHVPYGRYYVSNLVLHDSMMLKGEHLHSTMLCPMPGTKGSWIKNTGNAGKISIMDIRFDGNNEPLITAALDLGTTGGGNAEWGTYSYMQNIEVSSFPNAIGIKLAVNVSVLYNCWTEGTHDGIWNDDGGCCLMAFGCGVMAFPGVGIKLQIADYWSGVEVEAPLDGSTPVEIHGAATIDGILIGPPNSLVNGKASHYKSLIKVDADAAGPWAPGWHGGKPARSSGGWAVNGLVVDNSGGFGSWDNTITVNGKGIDPSFSNTSSQTISSCVNSPTISYHESAFLLYISLLIG